MELPVTGWVALELTGSPADVALLGVTRTALLPFAGLAGGVLADRLDRVRLIRLAQWGNTLVMGALAASWLAGKGAFWQLLLATLWLGLSWGIDWPARRALGADLVGPRRVLQAVVLDGASQNVSRIAGSVLAGWLLAVWGGAGAVAAVAGFYLGAVVALLPVRAPDQPGRPNQPGRPGPAGDPESGNMERPGEAGDAQAGAAGPRSVWGELAAGLAYVRRDAVVWAVLVVGVLMDALLLQYQPLLAVFAERVLQVGPVELGRMGAASGVGATLGLLIFPSLRDARRQARAYVGGCLLACVAVLLFALSRSLPVSLLMLFAAGLGTAAFGTMQTTILLSRTSVAMRGRVLGLQALTIGSAPLGALQLSLVVERLGAPLAVALNAACCGVAVSLVTWRSRLIRSKLAGDGGPRGRE
jgi:MFS family permease